MALPLPHPWPEPDTEPTPSHPPSALPRLGLRERRLFAWGLVVFAALSDGAMSFLDHLDELRTRLVVSIAAVFAGVIVVFGFVDQIAAFMMRPIQ